MRSRPSTQAAALVRRRVATGTTAVLLGLTVALGSGLVSPAAAAEPTAITGVILGVGADETQRTVSWYSSADTAQQLQVAPTASVVNGRFPADSATFAATGSA